MENKRTTTQKDIEELVRNADAIDEICTLICKAQTMMGTLTDYLGKNPDCFSKKDFSALLVSGYNGAQIKADICLDYICTASSKIQELYNEYCFELDELRNYRVKAAEFKSAILNLNDDELKQVKEYIGTLKEA